MNLKEQPKISVIEPISLSVERIRTVLFRPFNLKKWFIIGFCAWLAYLGSGTSGPNFRGVGPRYEVSKDELQPHLERAKDFILDNLDWIIVIGAMAIVLIIMIWLILTWLSSRGRFMFLHCIAENKAEVKIPWKRFRRQSNSLFLFRIVLQLVGFIAVILFAVTVILIAFAIKTDYGINPFALCGLLFDILLFVCFIVVLFII